MEKKIALKDGCPGCGNRWDGYQEGQCGRCRRCNVCCGRAKVPFSCTAKFRDKKARLGYAHIARSEAAYQRYISNVDILPKNRRLI